MQLTESPVGIIAIQTARLMLLVAHQGSLSGPSDAQYEAILQDTTTSPVSERRWPIIRLKTPQDDPADTYKMIPAGTRGMATLINWQTQIWRVIIEEGDWRGDSFFAEAKSLEFLETD